MIKQQLSIKLSASMFCGAIGDAYGAPFEFMSQSKINELRQLDLLNSGKIVDQQRITDDTQLLLFTAEGLVRFKNKLTSANPFNVDDLLVEIAHSYQRWLHTQNESSICEGNIDLDGGLLEHVSLHLISNPGRTCIDSLKDMQTLSDSAINFSQGSGALSRIIPLAGFCSAIMPGTDYLAVFMIGARVAGITHGHGNALVSAGALNLLLFMLFNEVTLATAIKQAMNFLSPRPSVLNQDVSAVNFETVAASIEHAVDLANGQVSVEQALAEIGEGWLSSQALAIALYTNLKTKNANEVLQISALHGGDSDTTCSLAASIYGAIHGECCALESLVKDNRDIDETREVIDSLVGRLIH